ncbi:MAPK/MAK/MRK overlapping kinase [Araneus ventricosus]|uniref:MAPK/MAK/MRK overlapping kinase n=1 Tax=Araneus ventricosus TaxID=182803 RepID=A0A4Y2MTP4_ARAVE|nr:MAPK/MAK/MRK overlapping kinase [Araneus ventricosus]
MIRTNEYFALPFKEPSLMVYQSRKTIGYRILGKKGEGSFAEVMACQNLTDGQLYACKTLKRHFVSVEQALGLTEVRALRRLRPHVNVVQLHDIIL